MKTKLSVSIFLFGLSTFCHGQNQFVDNNYEKGVLVDGYKEGVWEYYDNNDLKLKLNYTTGKLLFLAEDSLNYAIKTETGWEMSQLDVPPRYIGSLDEISKILAWNLRYPSEARAHSTEGTVLLGFEINLQGQVDHVQILRDIGYGCGSEVMRVFQLIPDLWLVAQKDGKRFKSRYLLSVNFQIDSGTSGDSGVKEATPGELAESKALNAKMATYRPANHLLDFVLTAVPSKK